MLWLDDSGIDAALLSTSVVVVLGVVVVVLVGVEGDSGVTVSELSIVVVLVGTGSATREAFWQLSGSPSPKTINNWSASVKQNVALP